MRKQRNIGRLSFTTLVLASVMNSVVLMPTRPAQAQTTGESWAFTSNLNTTRAGHTSTRLPDGRVLVAGGFLRDPSFARSTELYDPATGTWSSSGNLSSARGNHTATLLPNGKVLIAGGQSAGLSINSAELYDAATRTWSGTGNLNVARSEHTATLLPNGNVLVAGGLNFDSEFGSGLNGSELYNPSTGMWSNTGNLNTARGDHTATLLPNGKVLIAGGGSDVEIPLNSAELYDPVTAVWGSGGMLNTARLAHTATLLPNGKVLVAGGRNYSVEPEGGSLNSAELFDLVTGIWVGTANLNIGRRGHTATLLPNGKVLVAGGRNFSFHPITLNNAELYDSVTGSWSITANLNTGRISTASLLLNGKVLVAGGLDDHDFLNSAELYDSGISSTPNQVDDAQFFVRQHYLDFLNRDADANGLAFWTNEIALCGGDQSCIEGKRVNVSAAFFLSIEFQQTGYLVYRTYKASYGNLPGIPVPIKLSELLPDTQQIGQGVIVNQTGWEQALENNKQAFTSDFVQRSRFTSAYPTSMTPTEFVDKLFANAGLTPSGADYLAAINEFGSATNSADVAARSRALRLVAESSTLAQQEINRAFVLMQYFGYLRRNPNDPPEPGLNFDGYNFWLTKLTQFNGDYIGAEMVKAFITSGEYRQRFGP